MAKTPEERRAAHAAYMREYLQRPESKAKEQARSRAYYEKNAERIKAKTRAYALARHESSPLIPCGCGCGEQIHAIGKTGKPAFYALGHRHRLPCNRPTGEANRNWKGDAALSGTIHDWIDRWWERTGVCEECGGEAKTHFSFDHRLGNHTREREDYRELCPRCHWARDVAMGAQINVGPLKKKPS